jgi:hypothetical protein
MHAGGLRRTRADDQEQPMKLGAPDCRLAVRPPEPGCALMLGSFMCGAHAFTADESFNARDLTGLWGSTLVDLQIGLLKSRIYPHDPSYSAVPAGPALTPEYQKKHEEILARLRASGNMLAERVCAPLGMANIALVSLHPTEIIQTPVQINWFQEEGRITRRIYLDGRNLADPQQLAPSYSGNSIGHWEGDVLVVETINVRLDDLIMRRYPHSEQMRVTERIKRVNHDLMHIDLTVEDPKALLEPWTLSSELERLDPTWEPSEILCEDNSTTAASPKTGRVEEQIPRRRAKN